MSDIFKSYQFRLKFKSLIESQLNYLCISSQNEANSNENLFLYSFTVKLFIHRLAKDNGVESAGLIRVAAKIRLYS